MLELGTMLSGRYEVLKRVGSGGMADVYMAKDHKLNRNVAVKVLKRSTSRSKIIPSKYR